MMNVFSELFSSYTITSFPRLSTPLPKGLPFLKVPEQNQFSLLVNLPWPWKQSLSNSPSYFMLLKQYNPNPDLKLLEKVPTYIILHILSLVLQVLITPFPFRLSSLHQPSFQTIVKGSFFKGSGIQYAEPLPFILSQLQDPSLIISVPFDFFQNDIPQFPFFIEPIIGPKQVVLSLTKPSRSFVNVILHSMFIGNSFKQSWYFLAIDIKEKQMS